MVFIQQKSLYCIHLLIMFQKILKLFIIFQIISYWIIILGLLFINSAANLYLISLSPCHNIKCGNFVMTHIACAIFQAGDVYFTLGAEARRHSRLVSVKEITWPQWLWYRVLIWHLIPRATSNFQRLNKSNEIHSILHLISVPMDN